MGGSDAPGRERLEAQRTVATERIGFVWPEAREVDGHGCVVSLNAEAG